VDECPCLWNSTLKEYCKKEVTDCVWQAVSEEMKVSCYVLIDFIPDNTKTSCPNSLLIDEHIMK